MTTTICYHCSNCLTPHFREASSKVAPTCPYCAATAVERVTPELRVQPRPLPLLPAKTVDKFLSAKHAFVGHLLHTLRLAA